LREGRFATQNGEGSSFGVVNPDEADKFSHLSINQKSFKESFLKTGRLDAEYYQPKYEDYQNRVFSYHKGWLSLGEMCNLKDQNYSPSDNKIYQYIELSNIDKSGGIASCDA
jgi:type I restriction enzyme S subunit/type I restriction enzyme M protein